MKTRFLIALAVSAFVSLTVRAAEIDAATQARLDTVTTELKAWAADPAIVEAVAAHNAGLSAEESALTQEKWKVLSLLDPFVRAYSKNPAGAALKAKRAAWTTEAFLSDAKGFKVAFLAKTTNWCHAKSPKHEVPMTGKTWQGPLTVDESTGLQQVQIAVPVLQGDQPIGSLVVGVAPSKL